MARVAEVLGERWTLLIIRELMLGPKRFSDLKVALGAVSASVLSDRLGHLESAEVIRKGEMPAPAASTVYELTETGRALEEAMLALARWGMNFLHLSEPDDQFEPEWAVAACMAVAKPSASPPLTVALEISDAKAPTVVFASGGPNGTVVNLRPVAVDARITTDGMTLLGMITGSVEVAGAIERGLAHAHGDVDRLEELPKLFQGKPPLEVSNPNSAGLTKPTQQHKQKPETQPRS